MGAIFSRILVPYLDSFSINQGLESTDEQTVQVDSSNIDIRPITEGIQDRYSGSDFNYEVNDTGGVNLMQQILIKFFNFLEDLFGVDLSFVDYDTLEYIIYGCLALGILYHLIKVLIKSPVSTIFKTEAKSISDVDFIEENLGERIDFDRLISNAVKEGNYRLAIRYSYLKCLNQLSKSGIIDWHSEKTNTDYYHEIKDQKLKRLFKEATGIYDFIWYGEFLINKDKYLDFNSRFQQLLKSSASG